MNQNGSVEEVNHYYPFGGTFASTSSVQPYKYNGKELDRQGGLDWYDYGARHYDAVLGRWHVVDPMAEKYHGMSPYNYCMNNPVKYIDPDGQTVVIWYRNDSGRNLSFSYSGGNITHSNPFVQSVITAYQYNKANGIKMGNGGGASTVAIVENTDIKVNVMEAIYDNKYSPDAARGTGCIYWKSDWGSQHDNGTVNSPATIFDHEADHALEHKINAQEYEVNRVRGSDLQYQTKEERRVITGSEQKTSRANGETRPGQVTRRNHNGKTVITKGVTSNVIDGQKHWNMRKERNLYGLRSHKSSYYSISLFLLLLFVTSCKSNQLLIDNNDVENVNFWFIGDVDTNIPITDCLHIVFGNDNHKTIIRDRKIIDRFVALVNQLKPAGPDSYIDLRVSSLIKLKPINGERRPDIRVCIGAGGYGVFLNDVLMKGNSKELQKFVQEELYDSLTPYEWLPDFIKGYLKDHPEEKSKYLPDE